MCLLWLEKLLAVLLLQKLDFYDLPQMHKCFFVFLLFRMKYYSKT